jgi:hypothetical protein
VAHLCAYQWSKAESLLSNASTNVKNSSTMLLPTDSDSDSDSGGGSNGLRAPREGEVGRKIVGSFLSFWTRIFLD